MPQMLHFTCHMSLYIIERNRHVEHFYYAINTRNSLKGGISARSGEAFTTAENSRPRGGAKA
jgi:hypothetical protein